MDARRSLLGCFSVAVCVALLFAQGTTVAAAATNASPAAPSGVPTGIGAGPYSVSGTADYSFTLMKGGDGYLTLAADASSQVTGVLIQNGTEIDRETTGQGVTSRVHLQRGPATLHLEGSGRAAVGRDFMFPGSQEFPADERLVATLAPDSNQMTVDLLGSPDLSVHVLVYDDQLALRFDAVMGGGDSETFQIPWPGTSTATLVAEPSGGSGTFGVSWSASEAPVLENSFLLPIPPAGIIILVSLAVFLAVRTIRTRRRIHRPG